MSQQPQQDWSPEYQRYLQTVWNPQYQRWFWNHYVEGQGWVFFDWVPLAPPAPVPAPAPAPAQMPSNYNHKRIDSAATPAPAGAPGLQSRRAPTLEGKPGSSYEKLDPSFCVRPRDFFTLGKVFSVLFTEAAGSTVTNYNDSISLVRFGEHVHTQVRRFIVVRQKNAHCYAVPVFTYGNQGTKKPGVEPREHAVAYSYGYQPSLLPEEPLLEKDAICIIMNQGEKALSQASRIFFGIHHPIQYNVKVKDLGYVHPEHMVNLLGYWAMENQEETNQAAEVTADGAREDPGE